MPWHPDVPDLPLTKPKIIENLEQMDQRVLDSMPKAEVDEMVNGAANAIAQAYKEQINNNYEECVEFVTIALNVTGSGMGGKVGLALVAASKQAAESASRIAYPKED